MNRIAQLVSVRTEYDLGGNQKQSEPTNTVGVGLQPAHRGAASTPDAGLGFDLQTLLGQEFKVAPDIVSQEHQLKPEFCSYSSLKNRKPSGEPVL
jgi:hypothetical protein